MPVANPWEPFARDARSIWGEGGDIYAEEEGEEEEEAHEEDQEETTHLAKENSSRAKGKKNADQILQSVLNVCSKYLVGMVVHISMCISLSSSSSFRLESSGTS